MTRHLQDRIVLAAYRHALRARLQRRFGARRLEQRLRRLAARAASQQTRKA
jgi:hypothetical protein